MIEIYTDGACSGNPGKGGWAFVIPQKEKSYITSGFSENTTNNIMELTAVLNALRWFNNNINRENLIIYTDSAYIANCFKQKWFINWKNNNWITAAKTPVKNKELWVDIIYIYECLLTGGTQVIIQKVEGHSDNKYNNLADKYAVLARKGEIYNGNII